MVIPEPPNRKVNRSIPTRAAPSAREAVFLAERMLRFEGQSCNWKKKKKLKKKIGNWKFCRPSNEIGSVQCDLKQNDKLLVWTDPIAPDSPHDPATSPTTEPPLSLSPPPSGDNKVWKTQKTAHSWRPVSSPPAKNDNEIRLEPIPATKLILLLWTNKTTK